VAVGSNGRILNSSDGLTWASVNSGTTAALFGVASSGTSYVAVGANGTNLSSF
jgi:hypothetical protein